MVLGDPKGERSIGLDICDEKVEQTQAIKILGVNLDDNLNFRDHIRGVYKKVGGVIRILRRLRSLILDNAKLLLYKSAIMPHLTYCYLVWHFCTASDSRKLKRLQERASRLVYKTALLILMFKVKNKVVVNCFVDIFNINEEKKCRRYFISF